MKRFSVPITKINKEEQMVWGYASTPARDYDGDIITLDALRGALPEYIKFSNIREMHGMSAVGVAKEAEVDDKGLYIGAKIVDPTAWLKVKEGVYKAFSIGGNATAREPGDPHTITGLQLIEISLVDRPANPEAVIEVFKAVGSEEKKAMANSDEDALRSELVSAVNALSGDDLKAAVADLHKHKGTDAPAPAAPVQKAPTPKPVTTEVKPPETPAVKIARCLKASTAGDLHKAVAKAVGFNDTQFSSVIKLDRLALANWLSNNHGLLDNIQKAVPDDSPLWNVKTLKPVTFMDIPIVADDSNIADDILKAAKGDDYNDKVSGDYGSHADAGYADTGHQADGKPRYPLKENGNPSEERIRAAWNYINKEKNQKPYTPEQVKEIKDKIISAWKAHIDKDGPPSAKDDTTKAQKPNTETNVTQIKAAQPDAKGDLRKGLMTACAAIALLKRLDDLQKSIAAEEAREGDGSEAGARFKTLLSLAAAAVQSYLTEEVDEMLSGENDEYDYGMPYSDYVCYADHATELLKSIGGGKAMAEILEKAIGDRTGEKGFANLTKFAEEVVAKASPSGESGDWSGDPLKQPIQMQDWKEKAQDLHDIAKGFGAVCTATPTSKAKKDMKDCPHCSEENKEDAEKCTKCGKAMTKAAKVEPVVVKGKKGKDDEGGDAEAEATDGEDDNESDDEGGSDNPKKPAKKKKAAEGEDFKAALTEVVGPLAKAMQDLQDQFKALKKNPPLPGKTPVAKAVTKDGDVENRPEPQEVKKNLTPDEQRQQVLGDILKAPRLLKP